MTYDEMREEVAEAIWDVRRDHEDRCDQELKELGKDHPVWEEADSVITTLAGLGLLVLP
ncbi:hypothetical protein LZ838_09305 [Pseudomonas sp. AA27]|uniref:hypothetical protein n=1 Tax=Pseudomonas sp. AA27 TaxID=2908652 RepID=UPI001F3F7C4E|nr:hypothetical protein [Pseudomonas sp. AA27]MCF1487557.1 hypothetical protein [Pseudomonas sp. AA27]